MHLVNHVQRPYGLVAAAVKIGCGQQHNTSRTVINPPLCTAGTVSCADRAGSGKRRIDDRPGRVVLLTATEFDSRSDEAVRPLHMVDKVHGGRLSIGFRYEPSVTDS